MRWTPEPFDSLLVKGGAPPKKDWIVEGFLPNEFTLGLIAEESSGKSLVSLDLALAVASGQDFLGRKVCAPGRVLYFDEENPTIAIQERLFGLCAGRRLGVEVAKNLHFYRFCFGSCNNPQVWDHALRETLTSVGSYRLVVIDTYSCLFGPNPLPNAENDNTLARAMLGRLRRTIITGAPEPRSLLILHHTSKDIFTRGKPRGAGGFANHVDNYYGLHNDGPANEHGFYPTVLKPGKHRLLEGIEPLGISLVKTLGGVYRLLPREPTVRKGRR